MQVRAGFAVLLVLTGCGTKSAVPADQSRITGPTAIVRLPVQYLGTETSVSSRLMLTQGGEDEPPEGPESFDVFDDGTLAIADPLAQRIALYGPDASYKGEARTGFSVDGVARGPEVIARDAGTGQWFTRAQSGEYTSPAQNPYAEPVSARLLQQGRAFVPGRGADAETLGIAVSWSESRLLSVERLGEDADGSIYVGLEASPAGLDQVQKIIRKYARNGTIVAEVRNIPLDYYIAPRDEFRVHEGRLYQLQPRPDEVRINMWDLRPVLNGVK